MLTKLKQLLRNKNKGDLIDAEEDFDELMDTLDKDKVDLDQLEKHVREEFDDLGEDVDEISQKVDEVVKEKEPAEVK